ncbi:hypothetical protein [Bacteroides sp. 214]|nr:hypothetical protein [Bacteroides sp. 214]
MQIMQCFNGGNALSYENNAMLYGLNEFRLNAELRELRRGFKF